METRTGHTDWIAAYLDWSHPGVREPAAAAMELKGSDEIAAAYLEWIDAAQGDISREAILLSALRAQSDCVQVLRRLLEGALGEPHAPQLDAEFPQALAVIAADVSELRGKVQALRLH